MIKFYNKKDGSGDSHTFKENMTEPNGDPKKRARKRLSLIRGYKNK